MGFSLRVEAAAVRQPLELRHGFRPRLHRVQGARQRVPPPPRPNPLGQAMGSHPWRRQLFPLGFVSLQGCITRKYRRGKSLPSEGHTSHFRRRIQARYQPPRGCIRVVPTETGRETAVPRDVLLAAIRRVYDV
jgi:hypothetical protein